MGYVAERDRICCWKRQNKLLEEIGYVVETVSIFGRTTAVVHAVVNCYTPTIILIYDTPSFFALKNEKGFEALGPKGFGYLYYTSNRNLASKPAAKIHLFFE